MAYLEGIVGYWPIAFLYLDAEFTQNGRLLYSFTVQLG